MDSDGEKEKAGDVAGDAASRLIDIGSMSRNVSVSGVCGSLGHVLSVKGAVDTYHSCVSEGHGPVACATAGVLAKGAEVVHASVSAEVAVAGAAAIPTALGVGAVALGLAGMLASSRTHDAVHAAVLSLFDVRTKANKCDGGAGECCRRCGDAAKGRDITTTTTTTDRGTGGDRGSGVVPGLPGGVTLMGRNAGTVGTGFRPHDDPDAVGVSQHCGTACLEFRGVRYWVEGLTDDELATLWFLAFFARGREEADAFVSLDPVGVGAAADREDPRGSRRDGHFRRRFQPAFLGRTEVGRRMMRADERMKRYVCGTDGIVEPGGERVGSPIQTWLEAAGTSARDRAMLTYLSPAPGAFDLDVDVEGMAVACPTVRMQAIAGDVALAAFAPSSSSSPASAAEAASLAEVQAALGPFNACLQSLCEKHDDELGAAHRYMRAARLAHMLADASGCRTSPSLAEFVAARIAPLPADDGYPVTIPGVDIVDGEGAAIGRGGVRLAGGATGGIGNNATMAALAVPSRPWRVARPDAGDVPCSYCGWALDTGMRRSTTPYGTTACAPCLGSLDVGLHTLLRSSEGDDTAGVPDAFSALVRDVGAALLQRYHGKTACFPRNPRPMDLDLLGRTIIGSVTNFPVRLTIRPARGDEGDVAMLLMSLSRADKDLSPTN